MPMDVHEILAGCILNFDLDVAPVSDEQSYIVVPSVSIHHQLSSHLSEHLLQSEETEPAEENEPEPKWKLVLSLSCWPLLLVIIFELVGVCGIIPSFAIPYIALVLSIASLFFQCYASASPLALELILTFGSFPELFQCAVHKLKIELKKTITGLVLPLLDGTPFGFMVQTLVEQLVGILSPAIDQVAGLLSIKKESMPPPAKDMKKMRPLVGTALVILLALAQILALMNLGLSGDGVLVIVFALLTHGILMAMALNASLIVKLLVSFLQFSTNCSFQFLLRKVVDVKALQKVIDNINSTVERASNSGRGLGASSMATCLPSGCCYPSADSESEEPGKSRDEVMTNQGVVTQDPRSRDEEPGRRSASMAEYLPNTC